MPPKDEDRPRGSDSTTESLENIRKELVELLRLLRTAGPLVVAMIMYSSVMSTIAVFRGGAGTQEIHESGNSQIMVHDADPKTLAIRNKPELTPSELSLLTGEHLDTIYAKIGTEYRGEKQNNRWKIKNPFAEIRQ